MNYIYGAKSVLKAVKEGKVKKVVYAKGTPRHIIEELKKYNVELEEFNGNNMELGAKIGRSHSVMLLGYLG